MFDKFTKQIWLGNGDCSCSHAQLSRIHQLFEDALELIGCTQQAPRLGTEEEADEYRRDQFDVDRIADEIYLALTGRRPFKKRSDSVKGPGRKGRK